MSGTSSQDITTKMTPDTAIFWRKNRVTPSWEAWAQNKSVLYFSSLSLVSKIEINITNFKSSINQTSSGRWYVKPPFYLRDRTFHNDCTKCLAYIAEGEGCQKHLRKSKWGRLIKVGYTVSGLKYFSTFLTDTVFLFFILFFNWGQPISVSPIAFGIPLALFMLWLYKTHNSHNFLTWLSLQKQS